MICPNLLNPKAPKPQQPANPNDFERSVMSYYALYRACHTEDYENILKAFSPPAPITSIADPGQLRGKRIGIIGGGLAGLASAFELRKLGCEIKIFEANKERIGGRVYTYYFDENNKYYGELGPMRIPVNHETVWYYINLFGLDTIPWIQADPNAFIYLHQIRVRNDPMGKNVMKYIYPSYNLKGWEAETSWQELGYYGIEAPILQAPPKSRSEIIRVLPRYSKELIYWDSLNIRQMLQSRNLSQQAINMLSNLFPIGGEFLYNNFVDFAQEYFPVNFWYMYQIKGGMVKLPLAFYNSFKSKNPEKYYLNIPVSRLGQVEYKPGYCVKGIYYNENDTVSVSYTNKESDSIQIETFDSIICAVPFSVLRTFDIKPYFSSIKMQAIKEVNYGNSQKTLMYFNRRFWEDQGIIGGGSYTDLPITTIWYSSHYQGKVSPDEPGVIVASYNFNLDAVRLGNMTDEARFEKIKRDVEDVHGLPVGMLDKLATAFKTQNWNSDPLFRGAFCYLTPEQKKLFSWPMSLPEYNNKVFFAGEHISAIHRWQQGALQSGMEAANALAYSLSGSIHKKGFN